MEVELNNKIHDLQISFDFETGAKNTNTKRANELRKKLAEMDRTEILPPLLSEEELNKQKLSELELRWRFREYLISPFLNLKPLDFYLLEARITQKVQLCI